MDDQDPTKTARIRTRLTDDYANLNNFEALPDDCGILSNYKGTKLDRAYPPPPGVNDQFWLDIFKYADEYMYYLLGSNAQALDRMQGDGDTYYLSLLILGRALKDANNGKGDDMKAICATRVYLPESFFTFMARHGIRITREASRAFFMEYLTDILEFLDKLFKTQR